MILVMSLKYKSELNVYTLKYKLIYLKINM